MNLAKLSLKVPRPCLFRDCEEQVFEKTKLYCHAHAPRWACTACGEFEGTMEEIGIHQFTSHTEKVLM